jgi:ABC-type multidrug transport system ATPase subunit
LADPLLQVSGLTKHYGPITALEGLEFSLAQGETLAILGPNGAGKTTALRMLAGLLSPDSGSATLHPRGDGTPGQEDIPGFAPEEPAVWEQLTPGENCRLIEKLSRLSRGAHQVDSSRLLERFGLADCADQRARKLSLGNRKKLNLVLAMLHRPRFLLLDEPFSGLDVGTRELLRRELSRYTAEGGAIVLASHLLDEVDKIADRVLFLANGRSRGTYSGTNGAQKLEEQYILLTGGGEST